MSQGGVKANPGKINFASGRAGTSVHMSGELFKNRRRHGAHALSRRPRRR
jgi:hypothetical protein